MKWTSATALIAALSAAGAATTYVITRRPMGPAEIIAEVRAEMDTLAFEQRTALSQLALALAAAEDGGDELLIAEVLTARADVFLKLSDTTNALADLKRAEALQPGDVELKLRIAGLLSVSGEDAEALAGARAVITASPQLAAAWELLGQLETRSAIKVLSPSVAAIKLDLVREDAEIATELLMEFASRESDDPGLPTLEFRLNAAFSASEKEALYAALLHVEEAREHFVAARNAYAKSIELAPTPARVLALSTALTDASQVPLAIDLLSAAIVVPSLSDSGPIQFELIQLLQLERRLEEARFVTRSTKWDDIEDVNHLAFAAELLYKAGDFGPLGALARALRSIGGDTGIHWSRFYSNIQPICNGLKVEDPSSLQVQMRRGLKDLKVFLADTSTPEPFPGARAEAGFWLAKLGQVIGDVETEIFGLTRGFTSRIGPTADQKVQLAEALAKRVPIPWFEIDTALSDAINLEPQRYAEFAERWWDAGREEIRSKGMSVSDLVSEANRTNTAIPAVRNLGPAAYALLATKHLEDERSYSALQAANRALKEHPDLIPALDIALAAKLVTPNRYNVERDIVRRIELAGIDESIEVILNRIPGDRLDGEDLIAAIQAAPERFGKAAVARWFLEHGESENARSALERLDPRSAPDALLLLRAKALVEEERFAEALKDLTSIGPTHLLSEEAALLKARVLLELDRPGGLAPILDLDWADGSPGTYLDLADLLMSKGQAEMALEIIDRLDQEASTRTPEFYRRRILVDILTSRKRGPEAARESIERSRAYLRDGTPEIASILLAVSRRKWTDLPEKIESLRRTSFKLTPQKGVSLILLAERLEAGRRMAGEGLDRNERDPIWALVAAASDALVKDPISMPAWFGQSAVADARKLLLGTVGRTSRDPRETLAILLIADLPEWSGWLLPILEKIRIESGSDIWTSYLKAVALEASGNRPARANLVERLVEKHRQFGPGHEWSVQLAESAHPAEPMHPEVVRARRMRLVSLGAELIDDPVVVALAEASDLARRNDNASAIRTLQTVLKDAGSSTTEARLILGILMIRANQPSFAANFLFDAAMGDPGIFQTVVVDSLLFSIRYAVQAQTNGAQQRGAIGRERAMEMLTRLSERYPLDPMVTLARLELSGLPRRSWGEWAEGALDQLYKLSARRPLEALRRGSTRRWVELLIDVRVDLARKLVERDLIHEPGNLELWNLRAKIAEEMEDDEAAAAIYEALLAIDPNGAMGYSLAEIMIERGDGVRDVFRVLAIADRAQGGGGARSLYLRSLAQARMYRPPLSEIVKRLANLWQGRKRAATDVDPVVLGELYLRMLRRRGTPEDALEIAKVQETLASDAERLPYREPVMTALRGLHTRAMQEAGTP